MGRNKKKGIASDLPILSGNAFMLIRNVYYPWILSRGKKGGVFFGCHF